VTDRRTDGQTDGQTDGIAIAYARLAYMLSRAKTELYVQVNGNITNRKQKNHKQVVILDMVKHVDKYYTHVDNGCALFLSGS